MGPSVSICLAGVIERRGQVRVGIQLLPVNASSRSSNSFTACFLAVDITDRMLTKFSAPVVDRKQPETFWRSLTILMSRSAWLLSKGTAKSVAKRSTSSWRGPNLLSSCRGSVCTPAETVTAGRSRGILRVLIKPETQHRVLLLETINPLLEPTDRRLNFRPVTRVFLHQVSGRTKQLAICGNPDHDIIVTVRKAEIFLNHR